MAAPTLTELVTPFTTAEILQQMLDLLQANPQPFPTTSWEPDSVPQVLLQAMSNLLSKFSTQDSNVAMSGFLDYAASTSLQYPSGPRAGTSPWLDVLGNEFFQLPRQEPQNTIGTMVLTSASTPRTLPAGTRIAVSDTQNPAHRYSVTLTTQTTIQTTGTSIGGFAADAPGNSYNIGNNATLILTTAMPGVTVTNPAVAGTTTWITFAGANIESDPSYQSRLSNRWNELSTGSPNGAWVNWCFTASREVRTAIVTPTGFGTSIVTVYGDQAPVGSSGLSAIGTYLTARIPDCQTLSPGSPQNATSTTVKMRSALYGPGSAQSAALAAATTALQNLTLGTPIGGYPIDAGTPDTYGISNGFFEDAIIEATRKLGVTRAPVSVSNDGGANYVDGADFIMGTDVNGVPVVAVYDNTSFSLGWISI